MVLFLILFDYDSKIGDLKLVSILGCWWQNFDVGNVFWELMPKANAKRFQMWMTKIVTNIL